MIQKLFVLIIFCFTLPFTALKAQPPGIYSFTINSIKSSQIALANFKGRAILLVNIATRCGYTAQLADLEKLYQKYSDKGLVVLGMPSNEFGGQTPEKDAAVAKFCQRKYGVTFPLTTKILVTGPKKHPLAKHIIEKSGGQEIGWNFEKFLFDRTGKFISRYSSAVNPNSDKLIKTLEKVLN